MPRKSSITSVAEEHAAPGGAAAVDRALSVLSAFRTGDVSLSVTELADRTRLYKSTVLRLLASLAHGGMLRKTPEGLWALGPEIARLANILPADETQLLYSICIHGRDELGLAPDEYAGLSMVLLRLLAFKPPAEKKTLKTAADAVAAGPGPGTDRPLSGNPGRV